ncbi:AzlD domain-containing protein [Actinomyces sp. B33]|uniref:branched-chain amino acid transporter permease n=1 Tax=Actinomyces sp. B33 TaxID=2942131 RepID=UPI0023405E36|nr:AzlD domain-containing protein [Actinomyces sp. B33]MDC4233978.1 AzlD domain-containing protein [Actinomyces sp. B33]
MTHSLWYLVAVLAIVFVIDFALRAIPFVVLEPLRESRFVRDMAVWMLAGIMVVLVAATMRDAIGQSSPDWWVALVASAVTAATHLACGRRLIVSVAAGTVSYVGLLALV